MSDCSKTQDGKHVPDWKTVHVEVDGDGIYVDVNCIYCGESGCIGTEKTLIEDINWEE